MSEDLDIVSGRSVRVGNEVLVESMVPLERNWRAQYWPLASVPVFAQRVRRDENVVLPLMLMLLGRLNGFSKGLASVPSIERINS